MTLSTTGALPMPMDGCRRLSPAQALQRARALACLREKGSQCQGQVNVSVFFDGTGNNRGWNGTFVANKRRSAESQLSRDGHSNVARLFDAAVEDFPTGIFKYYVPGVGTPFPDVGDNNREGATLGGAAAMYGEERIYWAILQIYNSISWHLSGALLLEGEQALDFVSKVSRGVLSTGPDWEKFQELQKADSLLRPEAMKNPVRAHLFSDLSKKLVRIVDGNQRKVRSVNISVFGFSRGSAQARAFAHRLFGLLDPWGSGCGHSLAGVPVQLSFMGIFDTVASVGVAASSRWLKGKMNWAKGEMMSIHPEVKKCVHFAALHEQRINFPSDLAIGNHVEEVLYPGMHSDVGGGYGPGSQGKDSVQGRVDGTAKLAQIPLIDMHHAALSAGVLLMTMEELREFRLSDYFVCHPQLISDYNAWLGGHAVPAGTHEQQMRSHCEQYVQWKGERLLGRDGGGQLERPFFLRADDEDQFDLRKAQQNFAELVSVLAKGKADIAYARERSKVLQQEGRPNALGQRPTNPVLPSVSSEPGRAATQYWRLSEGSKRLLDIVIANRPTAPAVSKLFDDYVHDSLAGFYMSTYTELNIPVLRSDGYLRYREVFSVVNSNAALVCVDPLSTPLHPTNVPSVDQIFGDMGRAMGGF